MGGELGGQYPGVMGSVAQNFTPGIGFHGSIYISPLIDESLEHYIYVGFQSLTLKADTTAAFRIVPILAGLSLKGKTPIDGVTTDFGLGLGGSLTWLNVPNLAQWRIGGSFTVQLQPGIAVNLAEDFELFARTPVFFLIGTKQLSYVAYDFGLKMKF